MKTIQILQLLAPCFGAMVMVLFISEAMGYIPWVKSYW